MFTENLNMRNIYIIVTALVASFTMNAQQKGNIEFGFNVGYNSTSVSDGDAVRDPDYNRSFNFGASVDYYFSDRWSIKAKLIYDKKGWDNTSMLVDDFYVITDIDTDYITIPVMANWHFGRKRNWYLNFGPYIGFLTNAKDTKLNLDLKDDFNTTDAGLAIGIGVKIPVGDKVKIFIEYDYQGGFSDVFKQNDYDAVTTMRGAFNVGLNFML